jgi:glycosyltransferase involved in cell wall biosynthesis
MKVAMVTPMSPESAIADVMTQAVPALSERWDLDVWCPSEPAYRPCPVPVIPYVEADSEVLNALRAYDLVVYVLGDGPWHSRILPLARLLPGLVVLHDASLTNLVRITAIEQGDLDQLVRRVEGEIGAEKAEILRSGKAPGGPEAWLRFCAEVPFETLAIQGSLGAVVHSWWHARRVDGLLLGDVTVAPLPVPSARMGFEDNQDPGSAALLKALPADALLVVTVGAVNTNRRIDLLLESIASDDALAGRIHLWAVGPVEGAARAGLLRTARDLGLRDRFATTGRVNDSLMQEILARADIAATLRDPVLEGQSASVLTQLLSGTPVVVFDHAHYAELPDDVALKVDPKSGVDGVRRALRLLVDDESERARRGQRARDYALVSRGGSAYASALLDAGERALASKPVVHLTDDLSGRLRRLGLDQELAIVGAVSDIAFEMFDLG